MTVQPPPEVVQLLEDMLEPDGYGVVVHQWPAAAGGHARLQIVAVADACSECLVPKPMLRQILASSLPLGVVLDDDDLIYPSDPVPG